MRQIFFKTAFAAALATLVLPTQAQTVKSPDGNVVLTFNLKEGGVPTYEMTYKGKEVVKTSRLGYYLAKGDSGLVDGFQKRGEQFSTFDETWQPVWGEQCDIRNHYNQLTIKLEQSATERRMNITFRVYDEGMGLRYEFPQEGKLNYFVVKEERTEFAMTGNHGRHPKIGLFPRAMERCFMGRRRT